MERLMSAVDRNRVVDRLFLGTPGEHYADLPAFGVD